MSPKTKDMKHQLEYAAALVSESVKEIQRLKSLNDKLLEASKNLLTRIGHSIGKKCCEKECKEVLKLKSAIADAESKVR